MAGNAADTAGRHGIRWRLVGWSIAASLLLLPLLAGFPWTLSDFVFAGVLIGGVGIVLELTVRLSRNTAYRAGVGFALAASFLTIWANAAVGMIGDGDHPLNLVFLAVIALAVLSGAAMRFRADAMARVMAAAAAAHFLTGVAGAFIDLRGGIFSALFAGFWLLSALLFAKAARDLKTGAAAKG